MSTGSLRTSVGSQRRLQVSWVVVSGAANRVVVVVDEISVDLWMVQISCRRCLVPGVLRKFLVLVP